jgi:hypothetical protein
MFADTYSRFVLTVIAAALVYLCVVLTPPVGLSAQVPATSKPGEPTGPVEVVVVSWRATESAPVRVTEPVQVAGRVEAVRSDQAPDRVVIAGWERYTGVGQPGVLERLTPERGLPVSIPGK